MVIDNLVEAGRFVASVKDATIVLKIEENGLRVVATSENGWRTHGWASWDDLAAEGNPLLASMREALGRLNMRNSLTKHRISRWTLT